MRDEVQPEKSVDIVGEYEQVIKGYESLLADQEETFFLVLQKHKTNHERLSKEIAKLQSENDRLRSKLGGRSSTESFLARASVALISAVVVVIAWLVVPLSYSVNAGVQNNSLIATENPYYNLDFIQTDLKDDNESKDSLIFDDEQSLLTKLLPLKLVLTIVSVLPVLWVILLLYYLHKLRVLYLAKFSS